MVPAELKLKIPVELKLMVPVEVNIKGPNRTKIWGGLLGDKVPLRPSAKRSAELKHN